MPLILRLHAKEKVIINGVVVENTGEAASLAILNQGQILREKDILTLEEATTPALRIFYALQCLYLFPDKTAVYAESLGELLRDFAAAAPSATDIVSQITAGVQQEKIYPALKLAKHLIEREREILDHVSEAARRLLQQSADGGGSASDRGVGPDRGFTPDDGRAPRVAGYGGAA